MRQTLIIFWIWGFLLTGFVCYERLQYHSSHLPQKGTELTLRSPERPIGAMTKFAD